MASRSGFGAIPIQRVSAEEAGRLLRMSLLLRRTLVGRFLTEKWKADMALIDKCTGCGHCREMCPYELDVPTILKRQLTDYEEFLEELARRQTPAPP